MIGTDWQSLENKFILNESYCTVRAWLREVRGWTSEKIEAGNTQSRITSWGRHRAEYRQNLNEEKLEKSKQVMTELVSELYDAKREIFTALKRDLNKMSVKEKLAFIKAINVEIGEPTCTNDRVTSHQDQRGIDGIQEHENDKLLSIEQIQALRENRNYD